MLFLNRKGELTEGTVSNVFARKGTRWFTPELECGLLPGIWRRRQIEILNAEEKVLFPADLMDADEIRIGNSLRGTGVAAYLEIRRSPLSVYGKSCVKLPETGTQTHCRRKAERGL